jgi:hypothetical protein
MISHLKRLILGNLVSPYGLAVVSYSIFLFAWIFPPGLYTQYVEEQNLMFLDPLTFVFYTACVASFMLGVRAFSFCAPALKPNKPGRKLYRSSLLYLLVPLFLGSVLACVRLIKLRAQVDFIGLISSQQGNTLKQVLHSGTLEDAQWSLTLMVLTGVLWWASFRARQVQLVGVTRWVFACCFLVALVIDIVACIAALDRTNLMPLVAGLAVISLFGRTQVKGFRLSKVLAIGLAFAVGVVALFLALSFVRGASAGNRLVSSFLGYTIVSYNRLTALLTGVMHYEYGGKGQYLFAYLSESRRLNSLTGLSRAFGWPDASELWLSEFASTVVAGLNSRYIWSGTFGYIYADLGWLSLLYLFANGLMAGYLWAKFKLGGTIGLVLYPWVAFCILFWLGWNPLFGGYFVTFSVTAVALVVYDYFFLRSAPEQVSAPLPQIRADRHSYQTY